jgi:predicted metal-dependent peptidase
MSNPNELMSRIRTRLLLDQPFFGTLAMRLQMVEDNTPNCPTMMTNGLEIRWNRKFTESLSDQEQLGVVAHEVFHNALTHMYRRQHRHPILWNYACDYAINPMLLSSGFKLPGQPVAVGDFTSKGYLFDLRFKDMTAEQIYALLPKMLQESGKGSGKGQKGSQGVAKGSQPGSGEGSQPGDGLPDPKGLPTGAFEDPPQSGEGEGTAEEMTEQDWQMAAEQAARVAMAAGRLPLGAERLIRESREPKVDWRSRLRPFITNTLQTDFSWSRPNRRYISQGIYLPGAVKENVGTIVFVLDCSGSITNDMLVEGASEATGILNEAHPEKIVVIYHDTKVHDVEEFTPNDGKVEFKAKGGGGTAFQPVFDYIEKQQMNPLCVVWYTDLECYDSPKEPEYPVLWLTPEWVQRSAPFGETVRVTVGS